MKRLFLTFGTFLTFRTFLTFPTFLTLAALLAVAAPQSVLAIPVTVSVDQWQSADGNFRFSALHGATGASATIGGALFFMSGSIDFTVNPSGELSGTEVGDTLTLAGSLNLNGAGTLTLAGALDFSVAAGDLIGTFDYTLTTGGGSYVETGSFYFFNNDYTNGDICDANSRCGDEYRLWGNNWDNVAFGLDPPLDNVTITEGGITSVTTVRRGIDLGGNVNAIPEPTGALIFGLGLLVVAPRCRRRR